MIWIAIAVLTVLIGVLFYRTWLPMWRIKTAGRPIRRWDDCKNWGIPTENRVKQMITEAVDTENVSHDRQLHSLSKDVTELETIVMLLLRQYNLEYVPEREAKQPAQLQPKAKKKGA